MGDNQDRCKTIFIGSRIENSWNFLQEDIFCATCVARTCYFESKTGSTSSPIIGAVAIGAGAKLLLNHARSQLMDPGLQGDEADFDSHGDHGIQVSIHLKGTINDSFGLRKILEPFRNKEEYLPITTCCIFSQKIA